MRNDRTSFVDIVRRTLARIIKNRGVYALLFLGGATTLILGNRSWSVESNLGVCTYEAIRLTPDRHGQEDFDVDQATRRTDLITSCMTSKGFIFDDRAARKREALEPQAVPPPEPVAGSPPEALFEYDLKVEEFKHEQDVIQDSANTQSPGCWKRDWMGHWL